AWSAEALPEGAARHNALEQAANAWAQDNPRAAVDYWVKNQAKFGDEDGNTLRQIAGFWVRENPRDAMSWARGLPEGPSKNSVLSSVAGTLAETNPQQAADYFTQLPPAAQKTAAEQIAQQWGQSDPDAAANWAQSLPESDARKEAVRTVASALAAQDLV